MQRILYGFGLNCVHLPGSYTANLYGQVSCDYTCSQSQGMVLNDLRKSHQVSYNCTLLQRNDNKLANCCSDYAVHTTTDS